MENHTLFILNVLASLFYLGISTVFSGIVNKILLFLIIILFFYTSEKIKQLNKNPYTISRIFIAMSCIKLIAFIFNAPTNNFLYQIILFGIVLSIEFYELLLKSR